ncbi:MAG: bifunctional phosphoribosylaminoimidazolecarboxamide formyltransferase/IMP cyclohydrolase [Candidatus Pseudobacter hemicellulosilyticus]|uniref:Bifunctional purine biosynthesis protein PurH n=1 Tax=Candidatus Pseudobacter hemicellulosilyticus TaxID=3121375 RepID=A0AAJ5WVA5_9BACT|nr:MAG: bifunctional phosphoribosylaminoimidazolecarboxamide formyltransferase/IMP cyclohydrolase [Pseudobacter sp.]
MTKKIESALISVFYKDGLEPLVRQLHQQGISIYSTGGTQAFIEKLDIPVIPVENLTTYPSILGGRVKTLHPSVFGGILGRRDNETDVQEMKQYNIPVLDLVIVDLYPFEETVASTSEEKAIIEKIDIGGPSMIRGAAKNFRDVVVVAAKSEYAPLEQLLSEQSGATTLEQRRQFAAKAFEVVAHYDVAIAKYFNPDSNGYFFESVPGPKAMRYGENPHQAGVFFGDLAQLFNQLNGKELSYNNLVDVDAAVQLIDEFSTENASVFAIIKHTNVCGIAARGSVKEAWDAALAGDPESAFGGVLVCNQAIDKATAEAINEIFFEVLIAPSFQEDALAILRSKKNRILLQQQSGLRRSKEYASVLNGVLVQQTDEGNYSKWEEAGGRASTEAEKSDLSFANLVCKHLKSNAIALVKDKQLIGKGCGQTSRIDALRQALEKAKQFAFDLNGAVLASDAFFPFNDCVQMGHAAGINAFIQPGGSVRDKDSIEYCQQHNLAMVMTGMRHFKH